MVCRHVRRLVSWVFCCGCASPSAAIKSTDVVACRLSRRVTSLSTRLTSPPTHSRRTTRLPFPRRPSPPSRPNPHKLPALPQTPAPAHLPHAPHGHSPMATATPTQAPCNPVHEHPIHGPVLSCCCARLNYRTMQRNNAPEVISKCAMGSWRRILLSTARRFARETVELS